MTLGFARGASKRPGRRRGYDLEPTPQQSRGTTLSTGSFALTALVCGALGAGVVTGVFLMSDPEPAQTDAAFEAIAAVTGRLEPRDDSVVVDDGTWTDADLEYCAAEAAAASKAAAERRLIAVSTGREGLGGPSSDMIRQAAYLLCNMTRKPTHLCRGYWHKTIIEDIQDYAPAFREVTKQAYWMNYDLLERRQGSVEDSFRQIVTNDIRQTTRELARLHDEITEAFRTLIADGIIKPDAFGVFFGLGIPPDIAAMIGDAERVRNVC